MLFFRRIWQGHFLFQNMLSALKVRFGEHGAERLGVTHEALTRSSTSSSESALSLELPKLYPIERVMKLVSKR